MVHFNHDSDFEEINLTYNISLRESTVQVFEEDCITSVPTSVVGVSTSTTIMSPTHGLLEVDLNIRQETVVGSGVWNGGNGVGYVDMCVRVDLVLDNDNSTSVNFHEQKIFVTIGLNQGFHVTDIDLGRNGPDQTNKTTTANYDIYACQCNSTFMCDSTVLAQGSDVYICVISNASNVEIGGIQGLQFIQGNFSTSPIDSGVEDALTAVVQTGRVAAIRSQLVSEFFEDANPANVVAQGVATIQFVNSTRRLASVDVSRMLQEIEEEDTEFSVVMGVAPSETDTPVAASGGSSSSPPDQVLVYTLLTGGLIAALVVLAMAVRRSASRAQDELAAP